MQQKQYIQALPPDHKAWIAARDEINSGNYHNFQRYLKQKTSSLLDLAQILHNYNTSYSLYHLGCALENSSITTLNLSLNGIEDLGFLGLIQGLTCSGVRKINLSLNNIRAIGQATLRLPINFDREKVYSEIRNIWGLLFNFAISQTKITHLDLSYNCFRAPGICNLVLALYQTPMKSLQLHGNWLGDDTYPLAQALTFTHIEHLSLSLNHMGNIGVMHLGDILPITQLKTLNLDCNSEINDNGAAYLLDNLIHSQLNSLTLIDTSTSSMLKQKLQRALTQPYSRLPQTQSEYHELDAMTQNYLPLKQLSTLTPPLILSNNELADIKKLWLN